MAEKVLRCAVYTRKSTEDGLEQEFNSLDAQYEACASYALSQRHEGWALLEGRYDDGGFSGGNMERPGLKRLLTDIEAGLVDIVLLYKIDRLTRSLTDFSRIVDVMDTAGASFVSITQSFNTTTSMGRLTLNMLLSFAQFEREVTGERIRDKIAASKKKGLWMGGPVPLGYEVKDRKLIVNEKEADQVRHIMQRYLALGTVPALVDELAREGYRTKVQQRASGPHKGGCVYRRGTLYHLLSNRIYRGMIVHKGKAFTGEHEAIVDEALWDAVQKQLAKNASGTARRLGHAHPSLLTGLLIDGQGRAMTPGHSKRANRRYRYYATRPDQLGATPAWRVPAHDLEQLVCHKLAERIADPAFTLDLLGGSDIEADRLQASLAQADLGAASLRSGSASGKAQLLQQLSPRIELSETEVTITLQLERIAAVLAIELECANAGTEVVIRTPAVRVRKGQQLRLVVPGPQAEPSAPTEPAPPVPRQDEKLIKLAAEAFQASDLVMASPGQPISAIAAREGRCRTHLTRLVALSCLAPDIVRSILEGKQPAQLTARRLMQAPLPIAWEEQRKALDIRTTSCG